MKLFFYSLPILLLQLTTAAGYGVKPAFSGVNFPVGIEASGQSIVLQFHNVAGGQSLQLFDHIYVNRLGEPFVITRLRYYISDIRVVGSNGLETLLSNRSYLVDEALPATQEIALGWKGGGIRAIRFRLGVDSELNSSGVQEGDLDPAKGMFWTWNSGYIFARLEGKSDSSHAPAHSLTWDIGGYRGAANAVREVSLEMPGAEGPGRTGKEKMSGGAAPADTGSGVHADTGGELLAYTGAGVRRIRIEADVLRWFDGRAPVRIAEHPVCHQPGALAMRIADNYARMFSVKE